MPDDHPYIIHRNELTGLQPDTVYEFRVGERSEVRVSYDVPAKLTSPIRFVAGETSITTGSIFCARPTVPQRLPIPPLP